MSRAALILANPQIRARAHRWIDAAPERTRVEFREPQRTLDQNSKLWAMLTDVARQHVHYGQKYEPDAWKILFLTALGKELRLAPALDGKGVVSLGTSSSGLGKNEMSDLFEFMFAWGAENGIEWSDPQLIDSPRGVAGSTSRAEFVSAAKAAAFMTAAGRTIIHSFLGNIGADWDLDDVIHEIEGADDVRWVGGLCDHDMRVTKGRRVYAFQVPMPALAPTPNVGRAA